MRKQSIAVALMGLSTLAAADNSVTMYGVLDFGAVSQSSSSGCERWSRTACIRW